MSADTSKDEYGYTEAQAAAIGAHLARVLQLRREPGHQPRRYRTTWGTKTATGIYRTLMKAADDIRAGTPHPDLAPPAKIGYLLRDRKERFVNKRNGGTRAWFRTAWRVVSADRVDFYQPWADTKAEARADAERFGIHIAGEIT